MPKEDFTPNKYEGQWTHFWDMNSGGGQKLKWKHIYIEADNEEAIALFKDKFERDPENVTCQCCGEDYSVRTSDTLEQATEYQRSGLSVEDYVAKEDVLILYRKS